MIRERAYDQLHAAFNMPHNFQTWTMSVFDANDRAKNGRRYLVALAIILALLSVPMILSPDGVYPIIRDALVYWGYYHLVRQHFGFQRLYERRMAVAGSAASPRESQLYARFLEHVRLRPKRSAGCHTPVGSRQLRPCDTSLTGERAYDQLHAAVASATNATMLSPQDVDTRDR